MKKKTYNDTYEDMLSDLKDVLTEQVKHLKNQSTKGKLKFVDQQSLFGLLKQLRTLANEELEAAQALSDDDLIRITATGRKQKQREQENESLTENSSESAECSSEECD